MVNLSKFTSNKKILNKFVTKTTTNFKFLENTTFLNFNFRLYLNGFLIFIYTYFFTNIYRACLLQSHTRLASFVGMACKTWLHSFSFVPILHRRSSTLPAMSHLLNRSSQSGRLFSSFANRPSPTPVHAQAKRGFSSKNDDVAVASRKRAHTLSLSLSL